MFPRFRIAFALLAALLATSSIHAQLEVKGQRVFYSGHSFHYFVPPIVADMAKKAKIDGHQQLGLSAIGGSRVYQHWAPAQTTVAKDVKDLALPADAIKVSSTARFPASGEFTVKTDNGDTVVTYTALRGNTFVGCKGGKGTLKAGMKVSSVTNDAKDALKAGKVDVFTMSPIYLPDNGIENFVKLGTENNPKIRILVQENWLPWDHYDPNFKGPKGKVDHNAPTGESLRKMHEPYFKSIDDHVAELNKKFDTKAVRVAPVGQAVIRLREKIIAGHAPGLKEQNDLFTDPIGHAKAPLAALEGYVYLSLIYERNPAGLPVPAVLGKAPEVEKLNALLQEIAWETVTSHPLSGVKAAK